MKKQSKIILFGVAVGLLTILALEEPTKASRVIKVLTCKREETK